MDKIITLKRRLRACWAEMEAIAGQQALLLGRGGDEDGGDKASQLLDLVEQRQKIMDEIDRLQGLQRDMEKDRATASWAGDDDQAVTLRDEEAAIRASIAAVAALDKASLAGAQGLLHSTGAKLGQARRNKLAAKHYSGSNEPLNAYFFDRHK